MATKKNKPTGQAKRYTRRAKRGKKGYSMGIIKSSPKGKVMGFGVTKTTRRKKTSVVTRPIYKIKAIAPKSKPKKKK